ncbi:MAG TPA: NAD-dependent epimerase/dehydratase family protein [Acidimicrobiales bacterium]|jgi:dTDP-L-rhamnose 4-epimerase|nr:NAD-dependent epimerase/dehydratase family protein [Acidimicrobiales bacterium]
MRVLVTGGGGFIGSHLAEMLVAEGHEVVVIDRRPAYRVEGCEHIEGDVADSGATRAAVRGVDAVCHLAARVGLGLDFSDSPGYVVDNDLATATLLAELASARFRGRLVLSSSMVVYGEGAYSCPAHGPVTPGPRPAFDLDSWRFEPACPDCGAELAWETVDESAPLDPRSVYAATKVAQEHLCSVWARETGASVAALRYHNVYGRRLPVDTPYAGVAALFRDRLRRGQPALVFEDGGQMRDFVHVTDVAAANALALHHLMGRSEFEAFNVASGRPVSILKVARAVTDAFRPDAPDPVVTGRYRMGDVRHVVASPTRAAERLGFRASVDLAAGILDLAGEPIGLA